MSIRFEILSEADIVQSPAGTPSSVVMVGPRSALARGGSVVCTFMSQSKLGINDFVPMIVRSDSKAETWSDPRPLWPALSRQHSIFCNISAAPLSGDLFALVSRTAIDTPGEPFWSDELKGLKANDLIWSRSHDGGQMWDPPHPFPLPYPGSAEVPGALLVTRSGRWIGVYSPYRSLDPSLQVETERVVAVFSDDDGTTWHSSVALRFAESASGGAEAWVTQLTDGRLLTTTWQVDLSGKQATYPNRYAISHDDGSNWTPTQSTGISANTTALTPLADNRALFITVRRGKTDAGIWLSVVEPTDNDFGILSDQRIWSNARPTLESDNAAHDNWTDFTFGEPCVCQLPDGTFSMVFWYLDKSRAGIRHLRLRIID